VVVGKAIVAPAPPVNQGLTRPGTAANFPKAGVKPVRAIALRAPASRRTAQASARAGGDASRPLHKKKPAAMPAARPNLAAVPPIPALAAFMT